MKLGYAFLANYAEQSADGTFTVVNAGIDGFMVRQLPEKISQKFIVAHFDFTPEECGRQYEFSVSITHANGAEYTNEGFSVFTPEKDAHFPQRSGGINTIFPIYEWAIETEGIYSINFLVDKRHVGSFSIGVITESSKKDRGQ